MRVIRQIYPTLFSRSAKSSIPGSEIRFNDSFAQNEELGRRLYLSRQLLFDEAKGNRRGGLQYRRRMVYEYNLYAEAGQGAIPYGHFTYKESRWIMPLATENSHGISHARTKNGRWLFSRGSRYYIQEGTGTLSGVERLLRISFQGVKETSWFSSNGIDQPGAPEFGHPGTSWSRKITVQGQVHLTGTIRQSGPDVHRPPSLTLISGDSCMTPSSAWLGTLAVHAAWTAGPTTLIVIPKHDLLLLLVRTFPPGKWVKPTPNRILIRPQMMTQRLQSLKLCFNVLRTTRHQNDQTDDQFISRSASI